MKGRVIIENRVSVSRNREMRLNNTDMVNLGILSSTMPRKNIEIPYLERPRKTVETFL